MTFQQYWAIAKKRWKLIVVCFLLVGAVASVASKLMTPLYQSAALIEVAVGSDTLYTGLLASDQLVQTEAVLATSDSVLREVASHYKGLTVDQLSREVTAAPRLNTQLFEIDVQDPGPKRAAALANDIAATLVKQQLQMSQQNNVQVELLIVQMAQPSTKPVQPNTLLNTSAGLLLGLLSGILVAVLFERLDTRVRTSEALTQLLNWPLLATIWQSRSSKKEEVFNPGSHDDNIESYRILRTNLGFSSINKPLRSLIVTSALPREGRSAIAANLALFMAKAGKNTLLVDADLRHPIQHKQFGISTDKFGLSYAALAMSMPTTNAAAHSSACLQPPSTSYKVQPSKPTIDFSLLPFIHSVGIPNLWLMPAGSLPPNPAELLDSNAMQNILTGIANSEFQMVIFDTPPLLSLADTSILASKVDGMLIVVDVTQAKKSSIKQMQSLLMRTGIRVIGLVENKQRRNRENSYYAYDYQDDLQNNKENNSIKNGKSPIVPETPTVPSNIFQTLELDPSKSEEGVPHEE